MDVKIAGNVPMTPFLGPAGILHKLLGPSNGFMSFSSLGHINLRAFEIII